MRVRGRLDRFIKTRIVLATLAMSLTVQLPAAAQEPVRILATGVFAGVLPSLAQPFEAANGQKVLVSIGNAGQVAARLTAGESADIVMSSSVGIQALAKQGLLAAPEVAIGKMRLGVAVPAGAQMPDITTPEAFRNLLLSTKSVAYIDPNGGGTSGPFFEKMFGILGIAEAVHAKAVLGKDGGEIVKAVASGSAAVGMTQASELIGAAGIVFAGYLPDALNLTTPYSASVTTGSKNAKAAAAFLEFISGKTGSDRLRQAGWQLDR